VRVRLTFKPKSGKSVRKKLTVKFERKKRKR